MFTGHSRPNSDCAKRYDSAYLTTWGTVPGQPRVPGTCDIAARPKRENARRSMAW